MNIHNMMEETVLATVNELFDDEAEQGRRGFCTCHQCRLDVACYVLNRSAPRYIVSGRGLAHLEINYQEKLQREADLVSLIHRGIDQVSSRRRPHFRHDSQKKLRLPKGFLFNFPQIVGRMFNSMNFEPISDARVSLFSGDEVMDMVNPNWPNPYLIPQKAPGFYSFWPYPKPAPAAGERKRFALEIAVNDPDYEPLRHYFDLTLVSGSGFRGHVELSSKVTIGDLYLIPAD